MNPFLYHEPDLQRVVENERKFVCIIYYNNGSRNYAIFSYKKL